MTDATDPYEPFGATSLAESQVKRLDDAKKSYEQAINRLWAVNAAGVFAALGGFVGGKAQSAAIFVALCAFVAGLLLLAAGALYSLIIQARIIRALEDAESVLHVTAGLTRRPSEEAGLSFFSIQTVMGALSAVTFFAGVGFGLCYAFD